MGSERVGEKLVLCGFLVCFQRRIEHRLEVGRRGSHGDLKNMDGGKARLVVTTRRRQGDGRSAQAQGSMVSHNPWLCWAVL